MKPSESNPTQPSSPDLIGTPEERMEICHRTTDDIFAIQGRALTRIAEIPCDADLSIKASIIKDHAAADLNGIISVILDTLDGQEKQQLPLHTLQNTANALAVVAQGLVSHTVQNTREELLLLAVTRQ